MFDRLLDDAGTIDRDYSDALAAIAACRSEDTPRLCDARRFADRARAALCNRAPTTARYSTFARLAWEGGWRGECMVVLQQMAAYIQRAPFQLAARAGAHPVVPVCLRNDAPDNLNAEVWRLGLVPDTRLT